MNGVSDMEIISGYFFRFRTQKKKKSFLSVYNAHVWEDLFFFWGGVLKSLRCGGSRWKCVRRTLE